MGVHYIMRKQHRLNAVIIFAVMLFAGAGGMITSSKQQQQINKGLDDFNFLSDSEFYKGKFVEGDVFEVYGEFAYEESYNETLGIKSNSHVTSHYYLIPLTGSFDSDMPKFITLEIKTAAGVKNAELLMEQTWNYQDTGEEPDVWNEFPIQGKVSRLDGEIEEYLYDWLTNDGVDGTRADYEDMICPYVITEHSAEAVGRSMNFSITITIIGLAGIGIMIFLYIRTRQSEAVQVMPQPQPYTAYTPVNGNAPRTGNFGNTTASGSVSSPADGGESARLMEEMSRLKQPTDADEFFGSPVRREEPKTPEEPYPEPKKDMDRLDTSELGIGIADEDK